MNPIRRRRGIRTYPATSETCAMQSQSTDRDHAGRHHPGRGDAGHTGHTEQLPQQAPHVPLPCHGPKFAR